MIDDALILLREELHAYFTELGDPAPIIIENIGLLGTENGELLHDSIVMSVVNMEEESSLKNISSFNRIDDTMGRYINRPVHLNLYVLIAANFTGGTPPNNAYVQSLKRISSVVQFFQGTKTFSPATSTVPLPPPLSDLSNAEIADLKLTLELMSLSFEQVNYLWGSLGGKQLPSVLYKVRIVAISQKRVHREAPLVQEITANVIHKT